MYKTGTELDGVRRQAVFYKRENKYDFAKTGPGKGWRLSDSGKIFPVLLDRLYSCW